MQPRARATRSPTSQPHTAWGAAAAGPRLPIPAAGRALAHTSPHVVVIGGGPAGLTTALMLSKRGWRSITVLEKLPSLEHEDPTKSYVYAIDGRGRKATDLLGLSGKLKDAGVEMSDLSIIRVPVSGQHKNSSMQIKDASKQTYWMPRKSFLKVLQEGVEASEPGSISVLRNSTCAEVFKAEDGTIKVTANIDGSQVTYEPTLLVGADGISSSVRKALQSWDTSGRFDMQKVDSASAGLRYKVLKLPPNPPGNKEGSLTLPNSSVAVLEGKTMRMGLLPIKDSSSPRTGNIILKPDHPFWAIDAVEPLYEYMEAQFPQLPIRQLISQDQAQACVTGSASYFPKPQSCDAMHLLFHRDPAAVGSELPTSGPSPAAPAGTAQRPAGDGPSPLGSGLAPRQGLQAVLLVGDAVHCFPPDLGQGVNSALEDVVALDQALAECGDDLGTALPLYEQRRMPDVKALIKLMQFGFPYQYNQDANAKFVWTVNFLLRLALSKLLPFLVAPPAFMMVQDPNLSYSQILERADRTTRVLQVLLGAAALVLAAFFLGRL